ncbi:hypothetical protein ACIGKR_07110 [Rhodococcus qingshengii]|uniref:hypothetical protein n=1 Tax=Rhodococcus qingshengii TaxID=334542 RepID=UPI0037CBDDFE
MVVHIDNRAGYSGEQLDAMAEGLDRMGCPESAEVIVSDNFVSEVRAILGSATYGIGRGTGVVAAKTISLAADRQVIVVNAEPVGELDLRQLSRLLAHEAGHVLIDSRMEGHPDTRSNWMGDQVLHSLAATALDEYRVEKALYAKGFTTAMEVDWTAVGDLATEVNLGVMSAIVDKSNMNDPEKLARDITAVHDWSSKKLAYTAAAVAGGALAEPASVPAKNQEDWADYIKNGWSHRQAGYREAPDAATPTGAEQLQRLVTKLMTVERHYLNTMGFFYREYLDTWGFHRRKDDRLFESRWNRAVRTISERDTEGVA